MSLSGKVVIVTGSAQGLGRAFAEASLKSGAKGVTVCDVKEEEGRRTAEALAETYGKEKVNWVRCDVTSEDDWKALFDSTEEAFGGQKVDLLVNNAGIAYHSGWKKCLEVCLMGLYTGTEFAYDRMDAKGKGGHIINIASIAGLFRGVNRDWTSYFTAKAAVVQASHSLGGLAESGKEGIRVDCICPSFADTTLVTDNQDIVDTMKAFQMDLMPVQQVADAFTLLATSEGSGRVIVCFNGMPHLHLPMLMERLLSWLLMGASLAQKARPALREFTPAMQIAWFAACQLLIYFVLRILFGLFF